MTQRRLQSFEFNDLATAPEALREAIVETLSRALDWGGTLAPLATPFARFLHAARSSEVLDLCSGAGKPAAILIRAMLAAGLKPPRFLLTDLLPHPEAWSELKTQMPEHIDFVAHSIDATAIAAELSAQRARVIINALHHFPPDLATRILGDAARQRAPIFIAECFERGWWHIFPLLPFLALAHVVNPLLAPRHRLVKVLLTWLTPIGALAGLWDGVISTLRVYSEAELRAMTSDFPSGYVWTYGLFPFRLGGRGYYFYGVPQP